MKKSPIETVLGVIVIAVALYFAHFAADKIDARPMRGYEITAVFSRSGGLESGNDIRISGIKVGSVVGLDLTDDYTAKVTLSVREDVKLPVDTTAEIRRTPDGGGDDCENQRLPIAGRRRRRHHLFSHGKRKLNP